ncbi:hypothetical protein ACPDXS_000021 [Vibrio cholerae]|uniref:hypothetical protein n=1 Tax=Vibrio cholerae TaxID=666 RepID=UPI002895379E|nr:hypothetical protein [Vibrio cholerae]ELI0376344.1 hypothetical protein [Vibrio cholerae]
MQKVKLNKWSFLALALLSTSALASEGASHSGEAVVAENEAVEKVQESPSQAYMRDLLNDSLQFNQAKLKLEQELQLEELQLKILDVQQRKQELRGQLYTPPPQPSVQAPATPTAKPRPYVAPKPQLVLTTDLGGITKAGVKVGSRLEFFNLGEKFRSGGVMYIIAKNGEGKVVINRL